MIIGVLKEIKPNEYRVASTPEAVKAITAAGHTVLVQAGAGAGCGFSDEEYAAAGASILQTAAEVYEKADLFYKVKEMFPEEWQYMNREKIVFTYIHSNAHPEETDAILESGVTAIAYEDVTDDQGAFPLLRPMSILAGKGGFLAALHHMQSVFGGNGTLLANIDGIGRSVVTIIGCGNSGVGAAELAAGFGNDVRILDINQAAMDKAAKILPDNITFLQSNRENLVACLKESDLVINCILWPKHRKDHLISREDLKMMKPSAMIADVACDDAGAVETCRRHPPERQSPDTRSSSLLAYHVLPRGLPVRSASQCGSVRRWLRGIVSAVEDGRRCSIFRSLPYLPLPWWIFC